MSVIVIVSFVDLDSNALIVGGEEVMAVNNKDKKTFALYPRGKPFLTKLSGTCNAVQGEPMVKTTESLIGEIRRGDAINIEGRWFRVSCSVGRGLEREQSHRSKPPLSVTSDKELSDKNVYFQPFTNEYIPLDRPYDGPSVSGKVAKRHGCSLDVRKLWTDTIIDMKRFRSDEDLEKELIQSKLITKPFVQQAALAPQQKEEQPETNKRKRPRYRAKK